MPAPRVTPMTLATVWHALQSICREMRDVVDRTSQNYLMAALHDISTREVRDLPVFDTETYHRVPRRRVHCPRCGPKLERLAWLHRYARVTARLAESVVRLCQQLPIKHVAAFYGLGWDTVKKLDKATLSAQLEPPDLDGLEMLAMDEFAIHKGHRYATVVIEPLRKRVLWVGKRIATGTACRSSSRCSVGHAAPSSCRRDGHERGVPPRGAGPIPQRGDRVRHVPRGGEVRARDDDRVRIDEANRLRQTSVPARSSRARAGCYSAIGPA